MTEPWVAVDRVSQYPGVARGTLHRIEARRLTAHRFGRSWKFELSEIDDWVRAGDADEPRTWCDQ